jgi:hypothetical protein
VAGAAKWLAENKKASVWKSTAAPPSQGAEWRSARQVFAEDNGIKRRKELYLWMRGFAGRPSCNGRERN